MTDIRRSNYPANYVLVSILDLWKYMPHVTVTDHVPLVSLLSLKK